MCALLHKVMAQSPVKNDLSAQQLHRVKEQSLDGT